MIQIRVQHGYRRLAYHVKVGDPISSLKDAIWMTEGLELGMSARSATLFRVVFSPFLPECQFLRYNGKLLEADKTFNSYSIDTDCILHLSVRLVLLVKTLTGKTLECRICLDESVLALKKEIQAKEQIPIGMTFLWKFIYTHTIDS